MPVGTNPSDALTGRELIAGRYQLERRLGKGGMGSVWEARDTRLERTVAVKLVARTLLDDDKALRRFEREAKALARLRSRHVVHIYDYGVDRRPFMVMERMQGHDLKQRLLRAGRLSLEHTARIVADAGRGLTVAHEAGIVHRDLKPANLFLVQDGDAEYVKVFDFGIAASREENRITEDGAIIGTLRYISPEQLRGETDYRADLWSLAVIAYIALTGKAPFEGDGVQVIEAILGSPPVPPSQHHQALGPKVDAFFAKALAKNPDARFPNATVMAHAFEELAGRSHQELIAPPHDAPSTRQRGEADAPSSVTSDDLRSGTPLLGSRVRTGGDDPAGPPLPKPLTKPMTKPVAVTKSVVLDDTTQPLPVESVSGLAASAPPPRADDDPAASSANATDALLSDGPPLRSSPIPWLLAAIFLALVAAAALISTRNRSNRDTADPGSAAPSASSPVTR